MYLTCKVKIGLKKYLPINFKPTCYYFYYTKKIQILYLTYYKTDIGIDVFKMKD